MVKFLVALLIAEFVLLRKGREIDAVRTALFTLAGLQVEGSRFLAFSYLATLLVDSSLLARVSQLAIFGPLHEEVTGPFEICILPGLPLLEPSILWRRKEGADT